MDNKEVKYFSGGKIMFLNLFGVGQKLEIRIMFVTEVYPQRMQSLRFNTFFVLPKALKRKLFHVGSIKSANFLVLKRHQFYNYII